jgi:uncharacterized membrane protein
LKVFSQKDTTKVNDSLVCIPKSIAKKIAIDLNNLDECDTINKVLTKSLATSTKIINNRDSVIILKDKQLKLSYDQRLNDSIKYDIVNKQLSDTRKSLKWSKTKTTISQIAFIALLVKILL